MSALGQRSMRRIASLSRQQNILLGLTQLPSNTVLRAELPIQTPKVATFVPPSKFLSTTVPEKKGIPIATIDEVVEAFKKDDIYIIDVR